MVDTIGEARHDYQPVDPDVAPALQAKAAAFGEKPPAPKLSRGQRIANSLGLASLMAGLGLLGASAITDQSPQDTIADTTTAASGAVVDFGKGTAAAVSRTRDNANFWLGDPNKQETASQPVSTQPQSQVLKK